MKVEIEKAIRETLVIENKQSLHIAVEKIMKIIDLEKINLLKRISATFLDKKNLKLVERQSDVDVIQAVGETIVNFPLN